MLGAIFAPNDWSSPVSFPLQGVEHAVSETSSPMQDSSAVVPRNAPCRAVDDGVVVMMMPSFPSDSGRFPRAEPA
ncbi:MAG TPA: hypothetical protein OIL96_00115 [Bifidobacteriaceae bacterium]|nr:hypothetical protein [Bifidobacteriaceae bacterium]